MRIFRNIIDCLPQFISTVTRHGPQEQKAVLACAQRGLEPGKWPILSDGRTHAHSMAVWHAECVTTGCPQPGATSSARDPMKHQPFLRSDTEIWLTFWLTSDDPLCFFSSKLSCSSITLQLLQRCDIDPVEQSKWISTCFTKCEQRCRPALVCVASECLWSQNEVIVGLEVFGNPPPPPSPLAEPHPPKFWHVERLNYRRQTQTIHSALLLASTLLIMMLRLLHLFYFNPQLMEITPSKHTLQSAHTHSQACASLMLSSDSLFSNTSAFHTLRKRSIFTFC